MKTELYYDVTTVSNCEQDLLNIVHMLVLHFGAFFYIRLSLGNETDENETLLWRRIVKYIY